MERSGEMKRLAEEVVKAFMDRAPTEAFLPCLARVADLNKSILESSDETFGFNDPSTNCTINIRSASPQPQFSILHLQILMWMMNTHRTVTDLSEQIHLVVRSGADCDLEIVSLEVCVPNQKKLCVERATPMEFIFHLLQHFLSVIMRDGHSNPVHMICLRGRTAEILQIIESAQAANRWSSSSIFSQSVVSGWSNLLFSEQFSDVTFVCRDGTPIYAHQNILSVASPYFKTYFTGPWSKQNNDRQWKIQVDSNILKSVLTYMYTGSFGASSQGMSMDTLVEILQVGHEFQISNLFELCMTKTILRKSEFSLSNIKHFICIAATFSDPTVERKTLWGHCVDYIQDNIVTVLMDADFMTLATESPGIWKKLETELDSMSRKLPRKETH
jgi:hypothetical protein